MEYGTDEPVGAIDLTDDLRALVDVSGIRNGVLTAFLQHSTAALAIASRREGVIHEILSAVMSAYPEERVRQASRRVSRDPRVMVAYTLSATLGTSVHVPVRNGELALGEWQAVYLIELNGPRDYRRVTVTIVGD